MQSIEAVDSAETASQQVVEALARADNIDPLAMTTPLYDVIDPDALNAVLDTDSPVEVTFEYDGHTVTVESDGRVTVDGVVFNRNSARTR